MEIIYKKNLFVDLDVEKRHISKYWTYDKNEIDTLFLIKISSVRNFYKPGL